MKIDFVALDRIESEAVTDFYRAAPDGLRASHGIDVNVVAGAACFRCRHFNPALIFRRATGLGVDRAATRDDLSAVTQYMSRQHESYAVTVTPFAKPATLADWLEAQGFARGYAWMKFARSCNEPLDAATDLDIRVVGREFAAAFGRVVVEGFGFSAEMQPWLAALPGRKQWICVMALAEETPVAGGAAYVDGGYAWLGFASTLAAHRRQGAQNAILARRLREAAVRGA